MITLGFVLIFFAGFSDGAFYLPAKFIKKWEWEHYWSVFTVGFLVISWILTIAFIPNIFEVYGAVDSSQIYMIFNHV